MKKLSAFLIIIIALVTALSGCKYLGFEEPEANVTPESLIIAEELPPEQEEEIMEKDIIIPEEPETAEEDKAELPKVEVVEGELVALKFSATDPDGDPITYSFSSPLNDDGEWQTAVGDAGKYTATISASDGESTTTQKILIVVKSLNRPPVLEKIDDITVNEGSTIKLDPKATDADGDSITITYSGWMISSSYTATYEDAGEHKLTVKASDGKAEVLQEVKITVKNVNRPPVLEIAEEEIAAKEGDTISIEPKATDPDGDKVIVNISSPVGNDGVWQTAAGDAGEHLVTVTASDGKLQESQVVIVTIKSLNAPPKLEKIQDVTLAETEELCFDPAASDPEGEEVTIAYSGWMTKKCYTTNYDDAGEHKVTITASDGVSKVSQDVTVTVLNKNRPPVIKI